MVIYNELDFFSISLPQNPAYSSREIWGVCTGCTVCNVCFVWFPAAVAEESQGRGSPPALATLPNVLSCLYFLQFPSCNPFRGG